MKEIVLPGGGFRTLLPFPARRLRQGESTGGLQFTGGEEGAIADASKQVRLLRFKANEAAQHMKEIEEVARVFGEPVIRLDLFKRRWRAAD